MGITDAANVISVTKGKEGKDGDGGMFYGVDAAHKVKPAPFHQDLEGRFNLYPQAHGLNCLGREIQGKDPHEFLARQGPFFISCYDFRDLEFPFPDQELRLWSAPVNPDDFGLFFAAGPGKIFEMRPLYHDVLFL